MMGFTAADFNCNRCWARPILPVPPVSLLDGPAAWLPHLHSSLLFLQTFFQGHRQDLIGSILELSRCDVVAISLEQIAGLSSWKRALIGYWFVWRGSERQKHAGNVDPLVAPLIISSVDLTRVMLQRRVIRAWGANHKCSKRLVVFIGSVFKFIIEEHFIN